MHHRLAILTLCLIGAFASESAWANRYYSPETGRFITRDPIGYLGGGLGLYEYVLSMPSYQLDPYGFEPIKDKIDWKLINFSKDEVPVGMETNERKDQLKISKGKKQMWVGGWTEITTWLFKMKCEPDEIAGCKGWKLVLDVAVGTGISLFHTVPEVVGAIGPTKSNSRDHEAARRRIWNRVYEQTVKVLKGAQKKYFSEFVCNQDKERWEWWANVVQKKLGEYLQVRYYYEDASAGLIKDDDRSAEKKAKDAYEKAKEGPPPAGKK